MKIIKYIYDYIKYLFCIIFIFLIMFFVFYFVTNFVSNIKGEKPFTSLYTIVSKSMVPKLNIYDIVVEFRVNENKLKVGDIITFESNNTELNSHTITHRINNIYIENGVKYFITKGDNNTSVDIEPIKYKDIRGKVFLKIPYLGKLQFFTASKLGWSIIIFIPSLIISIVEFIKLLKAYSIRKKIKLLNIDYDKDKNNLIKISKKIKILEEQSKKINMEDINEKENK